MVQPGASASAGAENPQPALLQVAIKNKTLRRIGNSSGTAALQRLIPYITAKL